MAAYHNTNNWYSLQLGTWLGWLLLTCCYLLLLLPKPAHAAYPLSSLRGQLVINEIMPKQSAGSTIAENDEFIELYNAGTTAIDLTQLRLMDGNLFTGELDGTVGNITGNTSPFNFVCTGVQVCEGSSVLPPKAYAVIWVGQKGTHTSAPQASFQAWLRNSPKLNDTGEDMWLYEVSASGLALLDYISVGSTATGTGINTNITADIWNFTYNAPLTSLAKGQSYSLSPNGKLSTGACWEPTTSGIASSRCSGYLPSLDKDSFGTRITSVGAANTELYAISGRVFHDSNVNGLDDSESGLSDIGVVLYNETDASCKTTRTDAQGGYRFGDLLNGNYTIYEVANAASQSTCAPNPKDPTAYLSTSSNQYALTLSNQSMIGINFADLREPSFSADNSRVIQPNSVAVHPHQFHAYSAGTVSFSVLNEVVQPALAWSSQLYRDTNCNQNLDPADLPLNSSLNLTANESVCILVKVIGPANVSSGATHTLNVQSSFIFGSGSLIGAPNIQTRHDLSKVSNSQNGAGNLVLSKSVWNVTRNSAGDVALPNEVLRYTLHYANSGNGRINSLRLNDTIPAFTSLLNQQCVTTPSSLGACQVDVNGDALEWQFSGELQAGESGVVSFEVKVD